MKVLIFKKETPFFWVHPPIFRIIQQRTTNKTYQQHISIHIYIIYIHYILYTYAVLQFNSSQTHRFAEFEIWPLETKVNQGRTDFNYTSPETCGPQEFGSLNPDKDLVWMVKNTVFSCI